MVIMHGLQHDLTLPRQVNVVSHTVKQSSGCQRFHLSDLKHSWFI